MQYMEVILSETNEQLIIQITIYKHFADVHGLKFLSLWGIYGQYCNISFLLLKAIRYAKR